MKLKFGLRKRLFDVNIKMDYFLDNGACIQIMTKDPEKKQFIDWGYVRSWAFSKAKFQKLLKDGFIEKVKTNERLIYYCFTEKTNHFLGEFR